MQVPATKSAITMHSQSEEVAHPVPRTPAWFHQEYGLNDVGFLPGFPRTNPLHLPTSLVSEGDCIARWNRDASGLWYASPGSSESPCMQVRIEDLFLITHQRDMGWTKAIGLSFARGLLAEKKGLPVNWAEFATKQTNRRKKSDTSIVPRALKSRAGHEFHKYWVFDEESKTLKFDYEGAVDDWDLNSTRVTRSALAESGNSVYSSLLQNYTAEVIGRPLHKRGLMWQGRTQTLTA